MNGIDETLGFIEPIEGWLRPAQARCLWALASAVPAGGQIVEIGSYRAKSTIVLARAAGEGVVIHAIDPHAGNDRGPGQWEGEPADGQADHEAFVANLAAAGIAERVHHVRELSQHALGAVTGPIDVLYIDGAHGYRPARSDIRDWGDRVGPGGSMAIHDVYTSVFVTLAVARSLFFSRRWRYAGRERSLALYVHEPVHGLAHLSNAVRQIGGLAWFARNLVVRGLGLVGLEQAARILGHRPGGGVY